MGARKGLRGNADIPGKNVRALPESFQAKFKLDELARLQGYRPTKTFEDLLGNFWPDDECVDDFLAARREWHNEAKAVTR